MISVQVSEETGNIIENLKKDISIESLISSEDKKQVKSFLNKRAIENIPIPEQLTNLDLLCFSTTDVTAEDRLKNTIRLTYGINIRKLANGFVEVDGFNLEPLQDIYNYISKAKLQTGDYNNFLLIEKVIGELLFTYSQKNNSDDYVDFDSLFFNSDLADLSLERLRIVFPKLLNDDYHYIKGIKGIFPMFIEVLLSENLISRHSDMVYKNALNQKIKNLKLSKDASEFRTKYARITDSCRTDLKLEISDLKTEYSQSSH